LSTSFLLRPLGTALGQVEIKTQDLVNLHGPVKEGFLDRTGFTSIFQSDQDTDTLDLAVAAIGTESSQWLQENVDGVIFVSSTGVKRAPGNAHLLQDSLGLQTEIFLLDINDACTGFVRALAVADSFVKSGIASNILIVLSDTYTKLYDSSNLKVSPLFSDGASAMVFSAPNQNNEIATPAYFELEIINAVFYSEGALADNLTITTTDGVRPLGDLDMNGAGVFNFVVKHLRNCVARVLSIPDKNLEPSDVSWFVHQGSRAVVNSVEKVLGSESDSLFRAESYGNVVGSALPFQLFHELPKMKKDSYFGLLAFGVGLTMAGAVVKVIYNPKNS
jgi:3-oxoacyl-[acyl-carrier-protein] synthase-3